MGVALPVRWPALCCPVPEGLRAALEQHPLLAERAAAHWRQALMQVDSTAVQERSAVAQRESHPARAPTAVTDSDRTADWPEQPACSAAVRFDPVLLDCFAALHPL